MESSHLGDRIHAGNINNTNNTLVTEPDKIFSNWTGYVKWVFGLKWYITLSIVVFLLFFVFQIESALEIRKQKRSSKDKKEKEGMQEKVEKIKSILRKIDEEDANNNHPPKNVSFSEKETFVSVSSSNESSNKNSGWTDIKEIFTQFYKWWILPWVYVLFRNLGIQ